MSTVNRDEQWCNRWHVMRKVNKKYWLVGRLAFLLGVLFLTPLAILRDEFQSAIRTYKKERNNASKDR